MNSAAPSQQRIGADDHSARRRQWRAAADHGAVLHAVGALYSGQGHHAGHQPPSNQSRGNQAPDNQQQVATPAQQQTAPQVSATPATHAAIANNDDRPAAPRHVRHPRKQATVTSKAPRHRDENYVPRYGPDQYGAWSGGATQPRIYNSYGEPRFAPDARYLRRSRGGLYPMRTGPPPREQYWDGYRYGD
jgi:hypothetical protein